MSSWSLWRPRPCVPVFPELPPHRPSVLCLSLCCVSSCLQRSGVPAVVLPGGALWPHSLGFPNPLPASCARNRPGPRARHSGRPRDPSRSTPPRDRLLGRSREVPLLLLTRGAGALAENRAPRGHGGQGGPSDPAPSSLAAGATRHGRRRPVPRQRLLGRGPQAGLQAEPQHQVRDHYLLSTRPASATLTCLPPPPCSSQLSFHRWGRGPTPAPASPPGGSSPPPPDTVNPPLGRGRLGRGASCL